MFSDWVSVTICCWLHAHSDVAACELSSAPAGPEGGSSQGSHLSKCVSELQRRFLEYFGKAA